jgi:hypothetical protein
MTIAESIQLNKEQIARAFGVPAHMLADPDRTVTPRYWSLCMTSENHGTVGPAGCTFSHAPDKHERVLVVEVPSPAGAPTDQVDLRLLTGTGAARLPAGELVFPASKQDATVDSAFLQWVHDRMRFVHGENENVDYMHKLRAIIASVPGDRKTPNVASAAQQAAAPGALYSYMGESGRYELLGHAVGAGKCRLIDPLTVYRDTATGNLYFRHPSDFAARMVAIEGNASSGQGTSEAPQTAAARDVLAERQRQVKAEGYDHENDDNYVNDEMAAAAAFYVMPPGVRDWPMEGISYGATMGQAIYPDWMPPKIGDRRRDLVKGAALALAEIERLDRAAAPKGGA